jgi:hypothetical protein
MKGFRTHFVIAALLCAGSVAVRAQDFKLFDRTIQVHGSASQGFAYSNQNNYLTMNTSDGSPAFTDGALNLSTSITDKLRVGAQAYDRKVGQLDDFRPSLDFAYGDYRFASWFGLRVGRVKTAMGLYNDTQDADFLYPWALLPQSVYPLDLRSTLLSHDGGDLYGRIPLKRLGKLAYTGYAGRRTFDDRGGYFLFSADQGFPISKISGVTEGWDLRWTTPVKGLTLGSSWANLTQSRAGVYTAPMTFFAGLAYSMRTAPQQVAVGYGDYSVGRWDFSAEYRNWDYHLNIATPAVGAVFPWNGSNEDWFASGAYRVSKRLQVGAYHSNIHVDAPTNPLDTASNHIYDEVATARVDLNRFWVVKAEGHFMDGYGDPYSAEGFYARSNPDGMKPKTDMLMLRTSFNF